MDAKKKKLAQVDELIKNLGLSRDETVDYLTKLEQLKDVKKCKSRINNMQVKDVKKSQCIIDITSVQIGMIWYEDDTFSFDRLPNKKIKAVVELIENNIIYGDLTASELLTINEQRLTWDKAKMYIKKFSYPRQKNEDIVWYNIEQFKNIRDNYECVKKTFDKLYKEYRKEVYWSSTEEPDFYGSLKYAWRIYFCGRCKMYQGKSDLSYIRPVLALKVS